MNFTLLNFLWNAFQIGANLFSWLAFKFLCLSSEMFKFIFREPAFHNKDREDCWYINWNALVNFLLYFELCERDLTLGSGLTSSWSWSKERFSINKILWLVSLPTILMIFQVKFHFNIKVNFMKCYRILQTNYWPHESY